MNSANDHEDTIVLNAEEYGAIHAALAVVTDPGGGGQRRTLNSLLDQWSALATELELEGYSWCGPEFRNDIWCRSALAEVWPLLPPRVRSLRQPELDGTDQRYRQATVAWPGRLEDGAGWWDRRVPRRLEIETSERRGEDWPLGWEMVPFPRPADVKVIT